MPDARTPGQKKAANRAAIISLARQEHQLHAACFREGSDRAPLDSELARVQTALADAGEPPLRPEEIEAFALDAREPETRPGVPPPPPPTRRAAAIAEARKSYAAERAKYGKRTLCSELAWINSALGDRGMNPLSAEEIGATDIEVEAF
ncbi:MAG: hypothetical protein AB1716_11375 [Planctomycetota bacterium]